MAKPVKHIFNRIKTTLTRPQQKQSTFFYKSCCRKHKSQPSLWSFCCNSMMQKWSRRKQSHIPLIALLFFLFILTTILYNERYIQQIHQVKENQQEQLPVTPYTLSSNIPSNENTTKRIAGLGFTSLSVANLWFCTGFTDFSIRLFV